MKSLIGVMAVLIAAYALNCGASSTRALAEQVLQKQIPANANTVRQGDGVYGKSEFVSLRNKASYAAKIEVTGSPAGVLNRGGPRVAADFHS